MAETLLRVPHLLRRRAAGLLACAAVGLGAGCAPSTGGSARLVKDNPASLVDGYLIAHGMAASYVMSGRAQPSDLAEIVAYDHAALLAVASAQIDGGSQPTAKAEAALKALVDYTGRKDLSSAGQPPVPVSPKAP
jgi:hypothetical protein